MLFTTTLAASERRGRKKKTNPVFYADQLRLTLGGDAERLERALADPRSVDLLTWNIFASLDTHNFPERLAYRLQDLGGAGVRLPTRLSLWTGKRRQPLLKPSAGYVTWIRQRAFAAGGQDADVAAFEREIEVPVRIETPDVLVLVETCLDRVPRGNGGRDRILEIIDVGLDHARRLSKQLAVAVIYASGTPTAGELSERLNQLRDPQALAAAMPYRSKIPSVLLREQSWQRLLAAWDADREFLSVGGQPVRSFLDHTRSLGLR